MARVVRRDLPDGYFHVVTRGVDHWAIFRDDHDRRFFLNLFANATDRVRWNCHAVCLMTTHYHLVLESTRAGLSQGLHFLNGLYAQRFNLRHRRTGHLFGDRYSCRVIEDEDYLVEACRYVVNNPVRAGICKRPGEWPWAASSLQSEHLFPS